MFLKLSVAFSLIFFVSLTANSEDISSSEPGMSASSREFNYVDALLLCMKKYEKLTPYDSEICPGCLKVVQTVDSGWVISVDGKLQNIFGTWSREQAHCMVDRRTNKVTAFLTVDEVRQRQILYGID